MQELREKEYHINNIIFYNHISLYNCMKIILRMSPSHAFIKIIII